jgi:hypothetical protein
MKKSLLTIFAVSFSFVVFGQALLSDFEGNGMSGITITNWSSPSYTPEVVANPLKEGINTSNTVISFPAHDFFAYGMNLPGFLIFKNVGAATFNNYPFVHFKYLIQDNTPESDTIKIQLKLEGGTQAHIYSTWLTIPVPAGHANKWEEATMTLPKNADNSPTDHITIDFMISSNLKPAIPFFVDDITFTATTTGLNPLSAKSRLNLYQAGNSLYVKLDREMVIKNMEIYSISGALIRTYHFGYSTSEIAVPADMNSGCYVVKVNTAGQSISQKFIKR